MSLRAGMVRELVRLEEVHRAFGPLTVLEGINLRIDEGDRIGVVGHNGAGKTTLINCITGMTAPTSGGATVMGYSIEDELDQVRIHCSVCPQDNPIWNEYTVRQHLEFF